MNLEGLTDLVSIFKESVSIFFKDTLSLLDLSQNSNSSSSFSIWNSSSEIVENSRQMKTSQHSTLSMTSLKLDSSPFFTDALIYLCLSVTPVVTALLATKTFISYYRQLQSCLRYVYIYRFL